MSKKNDIWSFTHPSGVTIFIPVLPIDGTENDLDSGRHLRENIEHFFPDYYNTMNAWKILSLLKVEIQNCPQWDGKRIQKNI